MSGDENQWMDGPSVKSVELGRRRTSKKSAAGGKKAPANSERFPIEAPIKT